MDYFLWNSALFRTTYIIFSLAERVTNAWLRGKKCAEQGSPTQWLNSWLRPWLCNGRSLISDTYRSHSVFKSYNLIFHWKLYQTIQMEFKYRMKFQVTMDSVQNWCNQDRTLNQGRPIGFPEINFLSWMYWGDTG